jgi:hypothetical protein
MPPCLPVLQRFWRPHLAPVDPYRPGLVARVWPGSLSLGLWLGPTHWSALSGVGAAEERDDGHVRQASSVSTWTTEKRREGP